MAAVLGARVVLVAVIAGITIGVALDHADVSSRATVSKFGFLSRSASSRGCWAGRCGAGSVAGIHIKGRPGPHREG